MPHSAPAADRARNRPPIPRSGSRTGARRAGQRGGSAQHTAIPRRTRLGRPAAAALRCRRPGHPGLSCHENCSVRPSYQGRYRTIRPLPPPPPQPPPSPPLRLPAAERAAAGAPKAYRAEHVMPRPRHGVAHAPCAARHAICGRSPAQSPSATCRIPCIALQRGATVKPPSPRHQLGSGHELAPFTRAHARSSAPLPLPPPPPVSPSPSSRPRAPGRRRGRACDIRPPDAAAGQQGRKHGRVALLRGSIFSDSGPSTVTPSAVFRGGGAAGSTRGGFSPGRSRHRICRRDGGRRRPRIRLRAGEPGAVRAYRRAGADPNAWSCLRAGEPGAVRKKDPRRQ